MGNGPGRLALGLSAASTVGVDTPEDEDSVRAKYVVIEAGCVSIVSFLSHSIENTMYLRFFRD